MENTVIKVDIEKIKRLANEHDLTISRLEKYAFLQNGTVRKWDRAEPKISSIYKVSKILGIEIEKLLIVK